MTGELWSGCPGEDEYKIEGGNKKSQQNYLPRRDVTGRRRPIYCGGLVHVGVVNPLNDEKNEDAKSRAEPRCGALPPSNEPTQPYGVAVAFDGIACISRRLAGLIVGYRHGLPVIDQDLVILAIF